MNVLLSFQGSKIPVVQVTSPEAEHCELHQAFSQAASQMGAHAARPLVLDLSLLAEEPWEVRMFVLKASSGTSYRWPGPILEVRSEGVEPARGAPCGPSFSSVDAALIEAERLLLSAAV